MTISSATHIEKLTLVGSGIGNDFISDFTTNLMLEYFLEYTQSFARKTLPPHQRKVFSVRCSYDDELIAWKPKEYELPYLYLEEDGDFILLPPLDILTKDEAFICHSELVGDFRRIANSIGNIALREAINSYFDKALPISPKKNDIEHAVSKTINEFPETLGYYIKQKEDKKD
ncbi:hypothetical protein [Aeromonas dhakensis]|uniref:hypothetical protein n=1 Tax=Aeromonas dhakensis TaxID=196024 RepID=UPI001A8E4D8D|nr:hypothetical protein [Aeromonas dhakensis]